MSRQDQYSVSVVATRTILGAAERRDLKVWDKMSGGVADSEESKYRPGGMAEQISLGGYRTIENVTVEKLFAYATDNSNMRWLMNGVGSAYVEVTKVFLDVNKNPMGDPLVYKGILKSVTPPEHDSESTDAATWSIEVTTEGTIG